MGIVTLFFAIELIATLFLWKIKMYTFIETKWDIKIHKRIRAQSSWEIICEKSMSKKRYLSLFSACFSRLTNFNIILLAFGIVYYFVARQKLLLYYLALFPKSTLNRPFPLWFFFNIPNTITINYKVMITIKLVYEYMTCLRTRIYIVFLLNIWATMITLLYFLTRCVRLKRMRDYR